MDSDSNSAGYPTTAWNRIEAAKDPNDQRFLESMNWLINSYWRPVYRFLRGLGHTAADAQDMTQDFFLSFLMNNWIQPATESKGRFRNLLLTILKRYRYDHTLRSRRQTQFEKSIVSIQSLMEDSDRVYEPQVQETPEDAFKKQWKADVLANVRRHLKAYYEDLASDKGQRHDRNFAASRGAADVQPEPANKELRRYQIIFAAFHFVERAEDRPTQEALADRFGVTRDEVRTALSQVEKRYQRFLRQEIRDQVGSEQEIDIEIQDLL